MMNALSYRRILVALALAVSSVFAGDTVIKHTKAAEAAKIIKVQKMTVIDVRSPEEYAEGHIEGAKNIDFQDDKFEAGLKALDKTKPYLVHCAAGGRSTSSLEVFKKLGFTQIIHLDGGIRAWQDAKLPVVK